MRKNKFKVNDKLVRISFSETSNLTTDDCLTGCLKKLYRKVKGGNTYDN